MRAYEIAKAMMKDGSEPRPYKDGYLSCCCAHDDENPSAFYKDMGPIVGVRCFAGCSKQEIRNELKRRGWWPESDDKGKKGGGLVFGGQWIYRQRGIDILKVVRYDKKDGKGKVYIPYLWDGHGWQKSERNEKLPLVLFNEDKCREAAAAGKVIFDTEGEPKAEALIEDGFHAATIYGGSNKIAEWKACKPEEIYKGCAFVVVMTDHDKVGVKFALQKCRHLWENGIACKFFTFHEFGPITRKEGGPDVVDWREMFEGDAQARAAEIGKRVLAAPLWQPEAGEPVLTDDAPATEKNNVVSLEKKKREKKAVSNLDVYSETYAAIEFSELYAGQVVWVSKFKCWYWWTGKVWQKDESGHVYQLIQNVVECLYEKFDDQGHPRDALKKWYGSALNRKFLSNALHLAQNRLDFDYRGFDRNPWILNCQNGMIDLKTGDLLQHKREEYCSLIIPHDYLGLDCFDHDRWTETLRVAFGTNTVESRDLTHYMSALAGHSATGMATEKKFFLLWGPQGDNCKSTIVDGLRYALGPYAGVADKRLITIVPSENKFSDPSQLLGLRLAVTDEIFRKDKIDDGKFRKIISGGDDVRGSFVFKDTFDFSQTCTLWGFGNEKPQLDSSSNQASWNRVVVIPFRHKIEKPDPQFRRKLQQEAAAILSWIVRGCLEYQAMGTLKEPPVILAAKDEYKQEMDLLSEFFAEYCNLRADFSVEFGTLYRAYKDWCAENSFYKMTSKRFAQELKTRGFEPDRNGLNARTYVGLELKPEVIPDIQQRFYSKGKNYV